MKPWLFISMGMLLPALGCGHAAMSGSVVMAISPTEAHVCLVNGDVTVGDVVRIRRHTCVSNGRAGTTCSMSDSGRAEVIERLNEHYVSVRALEGATIREGDTVEPN